MVHGNRDVPVESVVQAKAHDVAGNPVWPTRSVLETRRGNIDGSQEREAIEIRMADLAHRDPEPVLEPLRDDVAMARRPIPSTA